MGHTICELTVVTASDVDLSGILEIMSGNPVESFQEVTTMFWKRETGWLGSPRNVYQGVWSDHGFSITFANVS
jgi:hypothetical protein